MAENAKVPARFGELVSELLRLTQEDRIHWSATDDPSTLMILRDAGHVLLSSDAGAQPYRLALYAPSGEEVQSYTTPSTPQDHNEARLAHFIDQLWTVAGSSARNNDGLVTQFLEDLRNG
ncbi:MAG TPA: hypothetical protein VEV43_08470 [Actinomycetota bacterium]|nr:hypothetical protein [Actinomycetota bacterium]